MVATAAGLGILAGGPEYELAAPTAQSAGKLDEEPSVAVSAPAALARFRLSLEEQTNDSMALLSI